ncbi:DNA polymerase iota-like isoform X1 [Palaemon carinicauda]|uniref:DNA polymerase iota-like isoform X1 n=1 Tax=Palaemon carinicauda TaxID=392227 RepID=UPI0035B57411
MDKNFENLEDEWTLIPEQHQRTILHFDIDCFYAQVEMVLNPSLQGKPVGIKQKEIMITCNYVARELGVKKSMFVSEALKLLPELILVDGSDLTHYRRFSTDITKIVQTFSSCVERLGLDENYLDVTEKVSQCLDKYDKEIYGHWYGDKEENKMSKCDPCGCGCYDRLIVGSHIAREVREAIFEKTGITCCAGIAHNKLIAKLISGYHKPNDQTVIFPWQVCDLMNSLKCIKSVPGIGTVTNKALSELGISVVHELQNVPMKNLRTKFDMEMAKKLKEWSFGIDESPVRGTVLPQSIGLEDAFKIETSFSKIKVKYKTLLERLLKLLASDGREPLVMKVSARKFDLNKRYGHRDSKQVPLSSSFFSKGVVNISESAKSAMLDMIIKTFQKLVDVSKPFQLTMVGLGMTKFVDPVPKSKSIIQFLQKTSSNSNIETRQDYRKEEHDLGKTILICSDSDVSERHLELQELKFRKGSASNNIDCEQRGSFPLGSERESKNNKKQIKDMNSFANITDTKADDLCCKYTLEGNQSCKDLNGSDHFPSLKESHLSLPNNIDVEVYKALPKELQEEILSSYKSFDKIASKSVISSTSMKDHNKISCQTQKFASIEGYLLVKERVPENEIVCRKGTLSNKSISESGPSCSSSSNTLDMEYKNVTVPTQADVCKTNTEIGMQVNGCLPDGIDLDVFRELPKELQEEVMEAHQGYNKIHVVSPTKSTKLRLKKRKKVQEPSILKYLKRS